MKDRELFETSFLSGSNSNFIEELYKRYLTSPNSVSPDWQNYFNELDGDSVEALKAIRSPAWKREEVSRETSEASDAKTSANKNIAVSASAQMLVNAYQAKGHFLAKTDPLGLEKVPSEESLGLALNDFELSEDQLNQEIELFKEFCDTKTWVLNDLLFKLKQVYSSDIGYEFSYIEDKSQKDWLINRIENFNFDQEFSSKDRIEVLETLIKVESFEQFIQTRFPGAKRFSVEGGESSIVCARKIIKLAASLGVKEVILGMPHRGRLNMLAKILNKPYEALLSEFQGAYAHPEELDVSGDVKYHLGQSIDLNFNDNNVHLSLTPNPSHLEAVNPVVAGKVRAKQDQFKDAERRTVMGVLFHGDAAFSGQGVVFESLMLSGLQAYKIGGIVHVVINNQIGFTATPDKARATRYCTDIVKPIQSPVFHVNGDCPDSVIKATKIAMEFKQKFGKDVVIDVMCYRLHGHNEIDEPRFTQPKMYKIIETKQTPGKIYYEKLLTEKVVAPEFFEEIKSEFKKRLDEELEKSKSYKPKKADWCEGAWEGFKKHNDFEEQKDTGVDIKFLKKLGVKLATLPENIHFHKTIQRGYSSRLAAITSGQNIDWGNAEMLAFGSLLDEGYRVRLTGQDSRRGTFSHRQSVLVDQETFQEYIPLNNISKNQAFYEVEDSSLSEFAVLGFEYGYSIAGPNSLVIWEAQFGDFVNGAQIIIDQFIASAETKWLRMSGLTMLLPHGYEGQGPEHSSARLERFLQLCAEDNMQVVNLTTPANYFHALRRQIHSGYRKPLIVMSPKSLLRHKLAVSSLRDMAKGTSFKPVIDDSYKTHKDIRKLILCSGKVYYELFESKEEEGINNVAIIRLEQIYPFPQNTLEKVINQYKNIDEIIWCQEEPENNGAWSFVKDRINKVISKTIYKDKIQIQYVGRAASASPAAGYAKMHKHQQDKLIKQALNRGE